MKLIIVIPVLFILLRIKYFDSSRLQCSIYVSFISGGVIRNIIIRPLFVASNNTVPSCCTRVYIGSRSVMSMLRIVFTVEKIMIMLT